jgi:hypothetical protein
MLFFGFRLPPPITLTPIFKDTFALDVSIGVLGEVLYNQAKSIH